MLEGGKEGETGKRREETSDDEMKRKEGEEEGRKKREKGRGLSLYKRYFLQL